MGCGLSWLIIGFVTRLTRRVSLVEQELLTLPEHRSSPPVFSGVRVTWSLVLYVCFVDRCLSVCTFSFGHCVVWSSSIYGFWLPLWYLQTLHIEDYLYICRSKQKNCSILDGTFSNRTSVKDKKSLKIPKGGNQNPYIEGLTTTMAKRKRTNNDLQNITHKTKDRVTGTSLNYLTV
jgi:hypothetical protein